MMMRTRWCSVLCAAVLAACGSEDPEGADLQVHQQVTGDGSTDGAEADTGGEEATPTPEGGEDTGGGADDTEPDPPEDGTTDFDLDDTTVDFFSKCTDDIRITLEADDATLDGWEIVESSFPGEDFVIYGPENSDGSATFNIDLPCKDTFTVWVRGRDQGSSDSHFVQVDGQPNPALIFEVDCTGQGDDYKWTRLNQRAIEAPVCEYVTDPWLQDWDKGPHTITFFRREPGAVSRIVITNEADYVPGGLD